MGCNCKNFDYEIGLCKSEIQQLRELFINRMTVDSETDDRRRNDFNQVIFEYWDNDTKYPTRTRAVLDNISMDDVLTCFDNAIKDWRRTWCDVDNCRRK